jgi:glutathione synthase
MPRQEAELPPPDAVAQAAEFAAALGMLRYSDQSELVHAPFAWSPCPIEISQDEVLRRLTLAFNLLAWRVANQPEFLRQSLTAAAETDPFLACLLELASDPKSGTSNQPAQLLISRSDYFIHQDATIGGEVVRQVEMNTIAASYPALAGRMYRLHQALWNHHPNGVGLITNDPALGIANALMQAFAMYGKPNAAIAMIVQPREANAFDQRMLELELRNAGIVTVRLTLENVADECKLREGHLCHRGRVFSVVYFRAGYAPQDLATNLAQNGRKLIENSDAILVPSARMQLAGTKKVQQLLTKSSVLQQFADNSQARLLKSCFAVQYGPEDLLQSETGYRPAWIDAQERPNRWVLKPQREGGGNNIFDSDIARMLAGSGVRERASYVLMERLRPVPRAGVLVRNHVASAAQCVSEIGRYGVFLARGNEIMLNRDVGYLVRTRAEDVLESGISAGFGHLDTLRLSQSAQQS